MNITSQLFRFTAAGLLLALGACSGGGGDNGTPPAPPAPSAPPAAGTVIGPAGGTVTGPSGAQVVIPPGALATDTTINIEQASAGAPALPSGFSAFGQMFAFTPHGTTFAVPVTMTLPYDPASLPAGATPALYKTNAQNLWEQVANATFNADSVSGQIASFSFAGVVTPNLDASDAIRRWWFSEFRGNLLTEFPVLTGEETVEHLEVLRNFGTAFNDFGYVSDNGTVIDPDDIATAFIGATADGSRFWLGTEAPAGDATLAADAIGSLAFLDQYQTFKKTSADASLTFSLPEALIDTTDLNGTENRVCPPAFAIFDSSDCPLVSGLLYVRVVAYTRSPPPTVTNPDVPFFVLEGSVSVVGYTGAWIGRTSPSYNSHIPLWSDADFDFVVDDFDGVVGGHASMKLKDPPPTYAIDLSAVEVGAFFTINLRAYAQAVNRAAGPWVNAEVPDEFPPSSAGAYWREPMTMGGGSMTANGVEEVSTPEWMEEPPVNGPVSPAGCLPGPGPDPDSGVIQFDAGSYAAGEANTVPMVLVTRTGGSIGAVTATITTSDGTAIGGADYTPVNGTVFFADNDSSPRYVEVPFIHDDTAEPDETLSLTLSQPGGCGALGTQTTTVVTILGDLGTLPPSSFSMLALNDTGVVFCADTSSQSLSCAQTVAFPGQDAQFGRDATNNSNTDGVAGFSFTKLDTSGAALVNQAATYAVLPWDCVHDEVTGLDWEVKTDNGGLRDKDWTYTWYNSTGINDGGDAGTANGGVCVDVSNCDTEKYVGAVNAVGLCGHNDWRLASREELQSIVDFSDMTAPPYDTSFFPNPHTSVFSFSHWTSTPSASNSPFAWKVGNLQGRSFATGKFNAFPARLVRGGN